MARKSRFQGARPVARRGRPQGHSKETSGPHLWLTIVQSFTPEKINALTNRLWWLGIFLIQLINTMR